MIDYDTNAKYIALDYTEVCEESSPCVPPIPVERTGYVRFLETTKIEHV